MSPLRMAFLVYGFGMILPALWCYRNAKIYSDKDRAWQIHVQRSLAKGLRPERTVQWEREQERLRVILLVTCTVFIVLAIVMVAFTLLVIS